MDTCRGCIIKHQREKTCEVLLEVSFLSVAKAASWRGGGGGGVGEQLNSKSGIRAVTNVTIFFFFHRFNMTYCRFICLNSSILLLFRCVWIGKLIDRIDS